ncbi:MAG: hypothetical protein U0271_28555 [Polyangiaceae bacterium]
MSHEIRTPLAGVMGIMERFLEDRARQPSASSSTSRASVVARCTLTNDVLDLPKLEAGASAWTSSSAARARERCARGRARPSRDSSPLASLPPSEAAAPREDEAADRARGALGR